MDIFNEMSPTGGNIGPNWAKISPGLRYVSICGSKERLLKQ